MRISPFIRVCPVPGSRTRHTHCGRCGYMIQATLTNENNDEFGVNLLIYKVRDIDHEFASCFVSIVERDIPACLLLHNNMLE